MKSNKVILVLVMMIFGYFLIPVTYALTFAENVEAAVGIDLTTITATGILATLGTVGSWLVMSRKLKSQVTSLGDGTNNVLTELKEKFNKVTNVEELITDFIPYFSTTLNEFVLTMQNEYKVLKDETTEMRAEFETALTELADVKVLLANVLKVAQLGFGNMKELVVNGYSKQIFEVGVVTEEVAEDEEKH